MTSARSCNRPCDPPRALLREDLRRYRLIPVVMTIAMLLIDILPLMLNYHRFEDVAMYMVDTMMGSNVLNMAAVITGCIASSCAVFGYLHRSDAVTMVHSRPLTRTQLFGASYLSGLVFVTIPPAVTAILFVLLQGAQTTSGVTVSIDSSFKGMIEAAGAWEVLSTTHVAGWLLDMLVLTAFTYSVACFAGILAGTGVIQTLLSLFLLGAPAAVKGVITWYMTAFLKGFQATGAFAGRLLSYDNLSPYLFLIGRSDYPFTGSRAAGMALYAAAAAVLAAAALAIYRRLQLEKEERSIAVPYVAETLVILLSFITVSVLMFFFEELFFSAGPAGLVLLTIILATAVSFPVYCMIADQTFRVFTRRNAKLLGIYAAVIALVLIFTLFDVTGYEKRVPAESEVESVEISTEVNDYSWITIDEPTLISKVIALHRDVTAAEETTDGAGRVDIRITYHLTGGRIMERNYTQIRTSDIEGSMSALYDDRRMRKFDCLDPAMTDEKGFELSVYRYSDGDGDGFSYRVPASISKGLIEAANKDIMKWDYKTRKRLEDGSDWYGELYVKIPIEQQEGQVLSGDEVQTQGRYIQIYETDVNICEFLEDHPEIFSPQHRIEE